MDRITIKCPKCGNCFETDQDSDTFFCSRCGCGYKILREEQNDPAHPQKIRIMSFDRNKKQAPINIGNKGALLIVLIAFIIWIVIFLILNA